MGIIKEFKEFISRGNVIDLAVGVIIGGAFTGIVTSLNEDIITPVLGMFGGVDFSNLKISLGLAKNAPVLTYGNFLTAVINSLITAAVVFLLIKVINNITKKMSPKEEVKITTKVCSYCKTEIPVDAVRCPHCTTELSEQK